MPPVPRPTKQQTEAMRIYSALLEEAVIRLNAIGELLAPYQTMPKAIVVEQVYLQLRMMCELTALCCLVAHGDLDETSSKRFQKEYAADNLLRMLEMLHPNFYPHPVSTSRTSTGIHIERIPTGFLTKTELVSLYRECGDRLHRGSLAKFKSTAPRVHSNDLVNLQHVSNKFLVLLKAHHVASKSNLSHYLCFLSHEQTKGKPMVVLAQAPIAA